VELEVRDKYDPVLIDMPAVQCVQASAHHAIFYAKEPFALYGIGSNRFAQLGSPDSSLPLQPQRIVFFDGLSPLQVQVSCGIFHSSFVLDGDLYTCGLKSDGQLGTGTDREVDDAEGFPQLAVFKDPNGAVCQVNVVKAVCGATHTIAIDGK
jgi:alpha-tubulin suppressor-like RCC1 family protein